MRSNLLTHLQIRKGITNCHSMNGMSGMFKVFFFVMYANEAWQKCFIVHILTHKECGKFIYGKINGMYLGTQNILNK